MLWQLQMRRTDIQMVVALKAGGNLACLCDNPCKGGRKLADQVGIDARDDDEVEAQGVSTSAMTAAILCGTTTRFLTADMSLVFLTGEHTHQSNRQRAHRELNSEQLGFAVHILRTPCASGHDRCSIVLGRCNDGRRGGRCLVQTSARCRKRMARPKSD